MIELTTHGYSRVKERVTAKGKNANTYATRAYEKGRGIEDYADKEMRRYLTNVLQRSTGDCVRVWGNNVFLFGHGKLITMFAIPRKLLQKTNSKQRRYYE